MKLNCVDLGLGGGSLLQVANRSLTQMMSYLIDTPEDKTVLIDGGHHCAEDGLHLYELLCERNKTVDLWIITHAHVDHYGAMMWLYENMPDADIRIKKICFHFPTKQWLEMRENTPYTQRLFNMLDNQTATIITPRAGDILECGGMTFEIVSVPEEYQEYPTVNSTSMIVVAHFPKEDVLFLGDFDKHAQNEFLRKHDPATIRKDIVQMAHHGQMGVDRSFYELIKPRICLYTAPQWLWENNRYRCNDPATAGTGPFETLLTRKWMEELGAEASYTHAEGDYIFR